MICRIGLGDKVQQRPVMSGGKDDVRLDEIRVAEQLNEDRRRRDSFDCVRAAVHKHEDRQDQRCRQNDREPARSVAGWQKYVKTLPLPNPELFRVLNCFRGLFRSDQNRGTTDRADRTRRRRLRRSSAGRERPQCAHFAVAEESRGQEHDRQSCKQRGFR